MDNRTAFCGGMNIGNEYCGRNLGGTATMRDTLVLASLPRSASAFILAAALIEGKARVEGPAAKEFTRLFLQTLEETGYLRCAFLSSAPPVGPVPT